jgi:phosphoglycerate dehydrogenase-like enzyme
MSGTLRDGARAAQPARPPALSAACAAHPHRAPKRGRATLPIVQLWIPDQQGREALGELPADVRCRLFARRGPPAAQIVDAEFLVPSHATAGLLELLPEMPALRVVQALSAGVDWLAPAVPAGVTLCDARGARDAAVAEWVLAGTLALVKHLPELRDRQRERSWHPTEPDDLAGRSALILGYGSIGRAVEERLKPFGVDIMRVARREREGVHSVAELRQLLPRAEVLIVLVPFTAQTDGLLTAELLSLLPPGALVINAARGRVLDQDALLASLEAGRVRAALDVTTPEPLPEQHPLWHARGALITPHLAGDSAAASRNAFALVGEQVRRYVRGEPLANVVRDGY